MTLALTADLEQKITQKAQDLGMTPEHFVLSRIQAWLDTSQQEQITHITLSNEPYTTSLEPCVETHG